MTTALEKAVTTAADKLAKALEDIAEVSIETRYTEVDAADKTPLNFENALPVALTTIGLDGDFKSVVPMRRREGGGPLEIDQALLDLHMRNVLSAIQYREKLLDTLLSLMRQRGRSTL